MADQYLIFGSELSPYSVKVRSYFRYKKIPHEWIVRSTSNQAEFQKYAKLPLIPLVITPDGQGLQDSTPILEHFEAKFPEPSIHPAGPVLAFLSTLIEEYADEWGNKPMFHYRWFYEADSDSAAERIARDLMPEMLQSKPADTIRSVQERMVPRLKFVGSTAETKETIEGSFRRQIDLLERHLKQRPYLFGGRPALADFGLYAQLYECSTDPTPGAIMRRESPRVLDWIQRMLEPEAEGTFEAWDALEATLVPLLEKEVGGIFLPWSRANEMALAAGEKTFSLQLGGVPYSQETQKYHAKSLGVLRRRYAEVADKSKLDPILKRAGCLDALI